MIHQISPELNIWAGLLPCHTVLPICRIPPHSFPINDLDHTIPSNKDVETTEVPMSEDRHLPRLVLKSRHITYVWVMSIGRKVQHSIVQEETEIVNCLERTNGQ